MVDTTNASAEETIFDRWDFAADFSCKKMVYDIYEIKGMKAKGVFSPSRAKLSNFEMLIGKVDIQADGQLDNVFGYLFDNEILKGELNVNSNYMNLNQFMSETGEATEPEVSEAPADPEAVESEYEPILVPDNINFHMNARMKTLIYDTYKLKNVVASLRVKDAKLEIVKLSCNAFGGSMALNGFYDTKDPENPNFEFGYDVAQLDFEQVAKGVPIITYFAPIAKALIGRFNSNFKISGIMGDNLYPKLASLNSEGLLETYDGLWPKNESAP